MTLAKHLTGWMPRTPRRIALLATVAGCLFATACSETGVSGPVAVESAVLAEPAMAPMADGAPRAAKAATASSGVQNPRRGVVTAGDIDDTRNFTRFRSYQAAAARRLGLPATDLRGAVRVQLLDSRNRAAAGVPLSLRKAGAAEPFYQGVSGVDGWVSVFPAALGAGRPERVEMRAFGEGQQAHIHSFPTGRPLSSQMPFAVEAYAPEFVDLMFVFDTTGSMGDELEWLTKEFGGIVRAAQRAAPDATLRFGLVAYRDRGDAYTVRNFGFTKQQGEMQRWLRSLDASGGGDYPEAAAAALQSAVDLNWRRGQGERLLFHVADAPAHKHEARAYLKAAEAAARKNVQIFGLGASGVAAESEFLMRQAALVTQGRYLFLTDDSGVGLSHAEPTIACYRVTTLRSLLTRVLASELTGQRKEASAGDVLRRVGTYREGQCRD